MPLTAAGRRQLLDGGGKFKSPLRHDVSPGPGPGDPAFWPDCKPFANARHATRPHRIDSLSDCNRLSGTTRSSGGIFSGRLALERFPRRFGRLVAADLRRSWPGVRRPPWGGRRPRGRASPEPTLSPSTFHSYQRNLSLHVIPRIGHTRLPDLDAHDRLADRSPGALDIEIPHRSPRASPRRRKSWSPLALESSRKRQRVRASHAAISGGAAAVVPGESTAATRLRGMRPQRTASLKARCRVVCMYRTVRGFKPPGLSRWPSVRSCE